MKVITQAFHQNFISRIKIQNFSNGCLWPANSIVHISMLVEGCKVSLNKFLYASVPNWIKEIPDHPKTMEMCVQAIEEDSWSLRFTPDCLKTQDICFKAVFKETSLLEKILDHLQTQETCAEAVSNGEYLLKYVPDCFKTLEICIKEAKEDP